MNSDDQKRKLVQIITDHIREEGTPTVDQIAYDVGTVVHNNFQVKL